MNEKKPTQNRHRMPKKPRLIEDGYIILTSDMIRLIHGHLGSIHRACEAVARENGDPDSHANCNSYYNGAAKLAELLTATLTDAPRTNDVPKPATIREGD